MSTVPMPLRFRVATRTLAVVRNHLLSVPLSLEEALHDRLPTLPPLPRAAHGFALTSLPEHCRDAMAIAAGDMIAFVHRRYTRHYVDFGIGSAAWRASIDGDMESDLHEKARRIATVSGGSMVIRRFRTSDEIAAFHDQARRISVRSGQGRLGDGDVPLDPRLLRDLFQRAAGGSVRAWLLSIAGEPAAFLCCGIEADTASIDYAGDDHGFADFSPGALLQREVLGDLFTEGGVRYFDFARGDARQARAFATGGIPCIDMVLLRASLAHRLGGVALGALDRCTSLRKHGVKRLGLKRFDRRPHRAR